MPEYRYLRLNDANFPFISGIFGSQVRSPLASDNLAFGQAVVDSFVTTDDRPLVCMTGVSNVFFHEKPSWLEGEEKWQNRKLMHSLHKGGIFQFTLSEGKVVEVTWLGYRLDFSQRRIQVAGRQVSSNELRIVLEGVEDSKTRSQIIEDWKNLLSEDFLAKYYN